MSDMDILEKIVINLLNNQGTFYASLISQMHRVADEKLETCGVSIQNGRITLTYNPKFLNSLKSLKEARAILEHECMHLVMDHIGRKHDKEHQSWNMASDLAINQLIDGLPKECISLDKFPKEWKMPHKDRAEVYYDILMKHATKITVKMSADGKSGTATVEHPDGSKEEFPIHGPDDHKEWDKSDGKDISQEVVKQAVKQALEQAEKQQGYTPSGLEEYIKELLAPPVVPWQQLLKRWVATKIKAGFKPSWKRPNRRFGEEQKGKLANRKLKIVVAIDTSGSIGEQDFQDFIAEIRGIMKSHKTKITIIECDAEVQKEYELTPFNKVDTKFKGRGGTDFRPVFDYVQEETLCPDLLIYFTDMWGSFPEKAPKYPVLWMSTTSGTEAKAPWGTVISMPDHRPEKKHRR